MFYTKSLFLIISELTFTYAKSAIKTLENGVEYFQS